MSRVKIQYLGIKEINGPLIVLDGVKNAHFDEMADIVLDNGEVRHGRVIRLDGEKRSFRCLREQTTCRLPAAAHHLQANLCS